MKKRDEILTDIGTNSIISNIQYPISNQLLKLLSINFSLLFKFPPLFSRLFPPLFCFFSILFIHLFLAACAPISDNSDPPAKPSVSLVANAVVSSVQLEMSSIVTIPKIGAVIRLAGEAAPSKAEAEANAGYVSLSIDADSTRKFSISQHYGSDFTDGLTLADVLAANTQYKLYLFFETNAISLIEGATLTNGVAALLFTTATLPPAGDGVWGRARTDEKFVAGLPEWHFDSDQKGVFVAYAQFTDDFTSVALTTRTADDTEKKQAGTARVGAILPNAGFLFNFSKLGGSHPDSYYYVISADDTDKQIGKSYRLEFVDFSLILHVRAPLTRY